MQASECKKCPKKKDTRQKMTKKKYTRQKPRVTVLDHFDIIIIIKERDAF
jgi:hypothetical protein